MPAITLGVAEVEERLRALRRRLNWFTLQRSLYPSLSAVVLLLTLIVLAGLRASPAAFQLALWTGSAVVACIAATYGVLLRRRWLDLVATAHIADRRGELTDRLSTLVDLRLRPRAARLAPVLVAQVLALGSRWQPQRIAPRRVPSSVYVLGASVLALAATLFMVRPAPPDLASPQARNDSPPVRANDPSHQPAQRQHFSGEHPEGAAMREGATLPSEQGNQLGGEDPGADGQGGESAGKTGSAQSLSDKIQQALQRGFHAEGTGGSRAPRAERSGSANDAAGRDDGDEQEVHRRAASDTAPPSSASQPSREAGPKEQGGRGGHSGQNDPGQQKSAPGQEFAGTSPAAGTGTSPGGLLATQGMTSDTHAEGPKTFKLTISSFLRSAEQRGKPEDVDTKRAAVPGAGRGVPGGEAALNERQRNDDALRKADIPAEYEDIVRRVYSLRAEQ